MKHLCLLVALALLPFVNAAPPLPGAVLARGGVAAATIVTAPQATRSAQLGAKELQYHLGLITGGAPAIVTDAAAVPTGSLPIYVGDCSAAAKMGWHSAELEPQEQIVRITPLAIWLLGRDEPDTGPVDYDKTGAWPGLDFRSPTFEVGTLYAVYDFLERDCGVRWYMLGDLGTVAPKAPDLTVAATTRRVKPWTTCRLIGNGSWARPGTFGEPDMMGYVRNTNWANPRDTRLYVLRTRMRGTDFAFDAHPFHNYNKLYGKDHPDWFVDSSPGPGIQLRFWKPEVVDQVTRNVLDYFAGKTQVQDQIEAIRFSGGRGNLFKLGPADTRLFGADAQPPIDPARKRPGTFSDGRASDYWFTFVNKVATRVAAVYPDKWISSSAYASHFEPPSFPMAQNVGVYCCNTEGWEADSYGVENFRAWKAKVPRVFTYEYWYSGGKLPAIRPHRLAAYIGLLRDLGIEGWNMEMISGSNSSLYHLEYYLTMRLLYDRDADVDALLAEYYQGFYGPAAVPMRRFWETFEQAGEQYRDSGLNRIDLWAAVGKTDFRARLAAALAEAEKLATADPYAARVAVIRTGVYDMVESRVDDAVAQANTPIPELTVAARPVQITLDGKVDDAAWQQAATTAPFVHMSAVKPTTDDIAKVLWDGANLYVAFTLIEPRMDTQALVHKTATSGICMDDSVEVFVDVARRQPAKRDYLQVMLTADGVFWRYYWGKHEVYAADMPSLGIETAAWRGPDRWTCEMKIPLQPIVDLTDGATMPKPGDVWGLGLYRNRRSEFQANVKDRFAKGSTGWSPTFGGYHVAARFGFLKFAK